MKKRFGSVLVAIFLLAVGALFAGQSSDLVNLSGTWELEINAGEEYYYLTMAVEVVEGTLKGRMSEQSGLFMDSPMNDILFEAGRLTFKFDSPTPPDGELRTVAVDLMVEGETCQGAVTLVEMGMSAPITGKKLPS